MPDIQFNGAQVSLSEEQSRIVSAGIADLFTGAVDLIVDLNPKLSPSDQIATSFGYLVKIIAAHAQARLHKAQGGDPNSAIVAIAATASYHAGQSLELLPANLRDEALAEMTLAMLDGSEQHPREAAPAVQRTSGRAH